MIQMTITRNKSGFKRFYPRYVLVLSEGKKFLMNAKKMGGSTSSYYLITLDQDKFKKESKGYLGKLRSNFLGTEFTIYNDGRNAKEAK